MTWGEWLVQFTTMCAEAAGHRNIDVDKAQEFYDLGYKPWHSCKLYLRDAGYDPKETTDLLESKFG